VTECCWLCLHPNKDTNHAFHFECFAAIMQICVTLMPPGTKVIQPKYDTIQGYA
jgi:hypothetical protein